MSDDVDNVDEGFEDLRLRMGATPKEIELENEIARLRVALDKQQARHTPAEAELMGLRAKVERLTQITKLQAAALDVWKKSHPHEQSPGACGRELAKAEAVVRAAETLSSCNSVHQVLKDALVAFRGRA